MKRFICLLLVLTQLAACTTFSTAPNAEGTNAKGQPGYLTVGHNYRITFREGGTKTIKVTSATAEEICAADGCIQRTEIASIERAESDASGLAGMAGIVLVLLAGLAVAAALSGGMHFSGGLGSAGLR